MFLQRPISCPDSRALLSLKWGQITQQNSNIKEGGGERVAALVGLLPFPRFLPKTEPYDRQECTCLQDDEEPDYMENPRHGVESRLFR